MQINRLAAISWPACQRPARWRPWRPGIARRRGAAGDHHDPAGDANRSICLAPVYIAEELLRAEGFTDIRYVP